MGKMNINLTLAASLVAAAAALSAPVHAASVDATAEIFSVTQSGTATLSFANGFFAQDIATALSGDQFTAGAVAQNLVKNNTAATLVNYAESSWSASTANLPYTHVALLNQGSATAVFQWAFDYTASGTGHVNLLVGFHADEQVLGAAPGENAIAKSYVNALLDGTTVEQTSSHFLDANGHTHRISFLVLGFDVADGQTGSLTLTASSEAVLGAPVPLPGATWLLGSALLGLGSVARRRTAA